MQNRTMKAVRTGTDTTFTFHVRDAQGNVLGVYNRTTAASPTITWAEQYIYGSGRLGSFHPGIAWTAASTYTGPHYATTRRLLQGQRRYELTNHLGNVLATIGDRRVPHDGDVVDTVAEYYTATLFSAQDYYPFGMEMPGRTFVMGSGYRYGFNGKEKDPTEFGSLTHYDYGFRIYNPAIAKFLSVDPLRGEYPWYTPYQFAGNMPILSYDLDGKEGIVGAFWGMVGEVGSQLLTNGFDTEKINWKQVGLAGAQGFISPAANTARTAKLLKIGASYALEYAKAAADTENKTMGDVFREGTQNIAGAIVGEQATKYLDKLGGTDAVTKAAKEARKAENAASNGKPRLAQTNRAKQAAKTASNAKAFHKVNQYVNTYNPNSAVNGVKATVENLIQSGTNAALSINEPEEEVSVMTVEERKRAETLLHFSKLHGRVIEMRYDHADGLYKHDTATEEKKKYP